jgi:hypothetical protein
MPLIITLARFSNYHIVPERAIAMWHGLALWQGLQPCQFDGRRSRFKKETFGPVE